MQRKEGLQSDSSQTVLLGRCLEFHLSKAIMKIEVMQMNKRIAVGKCVIVLLFLPCIENRMYLGETMYLCGTGLTWKSLVRLCFH